MDPVTLGLLIIGCAAALVLAGALVFGELSQDIGHDLGSDVGSDVGSEIDAGHDAGHDNDGGGWFSLPALAAFVGAFGFVGAIGNHLAGGSGTFALLVAGAAGLAGALPTAWLAVRLSRALATMPTDATLTASALVAQQGVVVTPIGAGTFGEVRVNVGGQPLKLYAKADHALPLGTVVFVVEALSESSVVVVEADSLS